MEAVARSLQFAGTDAYRDADDHAETLAIADPTTPCAIEDAAAHAD